MNKALIKDITSIVLLLVIFALPCFPQLEVRTRTSVAIILFGLFLYFKKEVLL